jgi:hypothetical protein
MTRLFVRSLLYLLLLAVVAEDTLPFLSDKFVVESCEAQQEKEEKEEKGAGENELKSEKFNPSPQFFLHPGVDYLADLLSLAAFEEALHKAPFLSVFSPPPEFA